MMEYENDVEGMALSGLAKSMKNRRMKKKDPMEIEIKIGRAVGAPHGDEMTDNDYAMGMEEEDEDEMRKKRFGLV